MRPFQAQIPHFVRMISLVMADQLRTVVLNSINAFSRLWDAFDLVADPHAASAGCPLEKQDGSVEVSVKKRKEKITPCRVYTVLTILNPQRSKESLRVRYVGVLKVSVNITEKRSMLVNHHDWSLSQAVVA